MPSNEDHSNNPFIRFKQHVNANISAGLNSVLPSSHKPNSQQQPPAQDFPTATMSSHQSNSTLTYQPTISRSDWQQEQAHAAALESAHDAHLATSILDAATSPTSPERIKSYITYLKESAIQRFVTSSPYSPLRLAHAGGWQPRPADLNPDMDPSMFTWIDAFEDLCAVQNGRSMMDLRQRYAMNQEIRQRWAWLGGFEPFRPWMERVRAQGTVSGEGFFGPGRGLKERVEEGREKLLGGWDSQHVAVAEQQQQQQQEHDRHVEGGLFGELDKIFKVLNKAIDDSLSPADLHKDTNPTPTPTQEPETEGDLYNFIQSAFNEARSLSTLFKAVSEGGFESVVKKMNGANDHKAEDDKTETKKEEYVDEHGYLHTKTTITTRSADGSRTSREERYTVRPADEAMKVNEKGEGVKPADAVIRNEGEGEAGGKGEGWFWKR